ncbi:DUF1364 domain-containing protein [Photobacterium lipolyticum]|uniref:DUF1364 domain-containing protein n=1 Tax=Photobacterium lipolyticum TaxID=266810 RepID=A0A2T3MZV7_9GAMM|nr:DUF1364 domain-containing protein [Photobacterium lipolyticum]
MALRSKKLTQAAKGQQCSVQIMGVCNFNPETVVLAHLPSSRHGLSRKGSDHIACFACSDCHDRIDGRVLYDWQPGEKERYMYEALCETLERLVDMELITVKGAKFV